MRSAVGLVVVAALSVLVWAVTAPWAEEGNTSVSSTVALGLLALAGGIFLAIPWRLLTGLSMGAALYVHSLFFVPEEENLIALGIVFGAAVWTCISLVGWGLRGAWDRWVGGRRTAPQRR
jgi:hypothetical protein